MWVLVATVAVAVEVAPRGLDALLEDGVAREDLRSMRGTMRRQAVGAQGVAAPGAETPEPAKATAEEAAEGTAKSAGQDAKADPHGGLFKNWQPVTYVLVASLVSALVFISLGTYVFVKQAAPAYIRATRLSMLHDPHGNAPTPRQEDKGYRQEGYRQEAIGSALVTAWAVLFLCTLVTLVLITLANYEVDPIGLRSHGHFSWESLIEPFMLLLCLADGVLFLSAHYSGLCLIAFMSRCDLDKAQVVVVQGEGRSQACKVHRERGSQPWFEFLCFRFIFDPANGRFRPNGEVEVTLRSAKERLASGLLEDEALALHVEHGRNEIMVHVPSVAEALLEEFHSKLTIYQLSVCFLFFFVYFWNMGIVWTVMVVGAGVFRSLWVTRRNKQKIAQLAAATSTARVLRGGRSVALSSAELVPGDVLTIEPGQVLPCDAVLVQGGAILDESMLTGEPMPIVKQALAMGSPASGSTLFAGTEVLESSSGVGIVRAIGGSTAKADLIRLVLFPTKVHFKFEDEMSSVYALLAGYALVCMLVIVFAPGEFAQGASVTSVVMRGLYSIVSAINPLLGVALCVGQSRGAMKLQERGINVLAPQRVPIAGCVNTLVLDKTGTITKAGMELHGVVPASSERKVPRQDLGAAPQSLKQAMASCHKLSVLNGRVIGNHVEMEMLGALGWRLDVTSLRSDGHPGRYCCGPAGERLEVLRVLDFDHVRMTSGCVVKTPEGTKVFVKGAAGKVAKCCKSPGALERQGDQFSAEGLYVLAVAEKPLTGDAHALSRDALEADLAPCGLLLFQNDVKPDSKEALDEIQKGGIQCLMCTGDSLLAGVAVARKTGLLPPGQPVVQITAQEDFDEGSLEHRVLGPCGTLVYEQLDTRERVELAKLPPNAALVADQAAWSRMLTQLQDHEIQQVLPQLKVLGRMKPEGKVLVIEQYQKAGRYVGMVGDGGNDCGALRAAHAGLALTGGDASIVAPFSSGQNKSLTRCCELFKEGRAAMANSIGAYKYFVLIGLVVTMHKAVLIVISGANFAEWEWIFIDGLLCCLPPLAIASSECAKSLSPYRPCSSLLQPRIIASVCGHFVLIIVALAIAFTLVRFEPFWRAFRPVVMDLPVGEMQKFADNFETATGFLVVGAFLGAAGFAFCFGSHHRQPVWKNWRAALVLAVVWASVLGLQYGERTSYHCLFRVNCDAKTSVEGSIPALDWLSARSLGGCSYGPQMVEWVKDADAGALPALIKEADKNAKENKVCMPAEASLDKHSVPEDLRKPENIGNVFSTAWKHKLLGILLVLVAGVCALEAYLLTPRFDEMERRAEDTWH